MNANGLTVAAVSAAELKRTSDLCYQRDPCDPWSALLLRNRLEPGNRLVDRNPGQFVFEEDHFLRRKRCRIVERRNRNIDVARTFAVLEKQMRAAARSKRTNPIRVRNLARFAVCHDQILACH